MYSGDGSSVELRHDTCGSMIAHIPIRELMSKGSIQRLDIAQELVRRANADRPEDIVPVNRAKNDPIWGD